MLIIPQWRTEQLLRQRLAELGGRVQRGTELTGLVQDAASVTATLVRAGVTERVRAGWLVGCEGGHSVIRKLLGVGFEDQTWEIELMLVAGARVASRAYEEEWLPVAAWALGISSRRHRELLGDTAAGGAAAPLAEELRQLGIGYVGGALARDIPHPTGRVRAGDRAPDASAATPRAPWYGSTSSAARTARCWPSARVMRTSSCELHGRASRCRGPAGRVGGERDLVDVDGHAHRAYDLDGDALVLVRPDGYIGLLAGPAPRRRSTRVPRPAHRRGGSASLTPGGQPIHDCGWQVSQDCC